MSKPRVAILASGGGTTAEVFIKSCQAGKITADPICVISNQKNPGIFEKLERLNQELSLDIKYFRIGKSQYPPEKNEKVAYGRQTKAEEQAIFDKLIEQKIDLVLLLGYMKLIGPSIVQKYGWNKNFVSVYQAHMLNTHPGLLPHTKGLYGIHIQQFVLINNKPAGHCIFAVDGEYDDGPIVSQHSVKIMSNDTPEILFDRVKHSEKKYLAVDLQNFISKQIEYNKSNE